MTRTVLVALVALVACKGTPSGAAATPDAAAARPQTQPVAKAPPPPDAGPPPLVARPGGPTVAACEQAADHLASLVVAASVPPTAPAAQREYVTALVKGDHRVVSMWCLDTAVPKEIDCVLAAKDFATLSACERFRREIPKPLLTAKEVTTADCERFYDRLRQFKIEEGVDPKELDKTKDQVIRTCQEKARPGTVACFIAAKTYAQARRCP